MRLTKVLPAYSVFRIGNVIAVFAITICMSRLTGISGFGIFSLMLANAGLLNLVSSFGLEASIAYHAASAEISTASLQTYIWSIAFLQLIIVLVVESVHFYFAKTFWLISAGDFTVMVIGGLYFLSVSIGEKYIYLFNGKQLFSLCSRLILLCNGLLLALLVIASFTADRENLIAYLVLYVACNMIQTILLIIIWHRLYKLNFSFKIQLRGSETKLMFSYSAIVFFTNVIQYMAYKADFWMLQYYLGTNNLGLYTLAARLSQFFWIMPGVFANLILVKMASQQIDTDRSGVERLIRYMNISNAFFLIFFLFFSYRLIPFIFGESFYSTNSLFLLLIPGSILFCNTIALAAVFAARKKLKINLIGSCLCLAMTVILNVFLIPWKGMKGAALSSSISLIVVSLYYLLKYYYIYKIPILRLFVPQTSDLKVLKDYIRATFNKNMPI